MSTCTALELWAWLPRLPGRSQGTSPTRQRTPSHSSSGTGACCEGSQHSEGGKTREGGAGIMIHVCGACAAVAHKTHGTALSLGQKDHTELLAARTWRLCPLLHMYIGMWPNN